MPVIDNSLLFPGLKPEVSGNPAVVHIEHSIALFPDMEFAAGNPDSTEKPAYRIFGPKGPVLDKIDNTIPDVMGNPGSIQSSPRVFLKPHVLASALKGHHFSG